MRVIKYNMNYLVPIVNKSCVYKYADKPNYFKFLYKNLDI